MWDQRIWASVPILAFEGILAKPTSLSPRRTLLDCWVGEFVGSLIDQSETEKGNNSCSISSTEMWMWSKKRAHDLCVQFYILCIRPQDCLRMKRSFKLPTQARRCSVSLPAVRQAGDIASVLDKKKHC